MIDKSAFRDLSYGLYIVSSMKDGRAVGCVVKRILVDRVVELPATSEHRDQQG